MAFQYEKISAQDISDFALQSLHPSLTLSGASRWVIDRKHACYLRYLRYDREQPSQRSFHWHWQQQDYLIKLDSHGQACADNGWCTSWRWLSMQALPLSTDKLTDKHYAELIADLKQALICYRDGALQATYSEHRAEFDF